MDLSSLGKTVAKYAPLLGAALPIPGGAVFGQLIAQVFGGDVNDPENLIKKIENDPEAEFILRKMESQERIEIERLILADKQNARQREIDYIKTTGKTDQTLKYLAFIVTFGFLTVLLLLFLPNLDINEQEKSVMMVLVGMLSGKFQTIIDYYFGSSNRKE